MIEVKKQRGAVMFEEKEWNEVKKTTQEEINPLNEEKEESEESVTIEDQPDAEEKNETSSNSEESTEKKMQNEGNQLEELQKKYDALNERYVRLHADLENFKRRSRQDQAAAVKYRAQDLLVELLPVMDNFERALQVQATAKEAIAIRQGVEMVYRQFEAALKNEGLQVIEAVGKPFDPFVHQAIMQVKEDNVDSGVVVEELEKGYQYKDRVLRPSMVKVNE